MTRSQLENHVTGLELQIVELVERRERVMVQGRIDEVAGLQAEIEGLQHELMAAAENLATPA
ncbi:MAG: hypothetical protein ACR2H3_17310 [Acidimicrobiales bacterium]